MSSKIPNPDEDSLAGRTKRNIARVNLFQPRDLWWRILDLWEEKRAFRRIVWAMIAAAVLATVLMIWVYPVWRQRTAISMAKQWLDAGRLDQASSSIRYALDVAPKSTETWVLAADLARRLKNTDAALNYSREAARLAPTDETLVLAWASDSLIAGQPLETERALASLDPATLLASAHGQRIAGELARRRFQLSAAVQNFENALRIDGLNTAIDEVPLGTILINSNVSAERQRGLDLLAKWTTSLEWGANTSRTLLNDALLRDDRAAMLRWAEVLRAHPHCTLADIPQCLLALSKADEKRFTEVLAVMQKNHARDSANIALLVGWLNKIGRSKEALAWTRTLPASLTQRRPAIVVIAEALRVTGAWTELAAWTEGPPWTGALEFIHLIYREEAALQLGNDVLARELQRTLEARAAGNGGQTLFVATSLYSWNRRTQAVALLWIAADQPGSAVEALGTLARHYQEQRDGGGQFRVFRRLRALRAEDDAVANNYAFFAALTGQDLIAAQDLAQQLFEKDSNNVAWRATYAFVLLKQNRAQQASSIMQPLAGGWKTSPVIAFAEGLTLAANGDKEQARTILASIPPQSLTIEEVELIKQAVR